MPDQASSRFVTAHSRAIASVSFVFICPLAHRLSARRLLAHPPARAAGPLAAQVCSVMSETSTIDKKLAAAKRKGGEGGERAASHRSTRMDNIRRVFGNARGIEWCVCATTTAAGFSYVAQATTLCRSFASLLSVTAQVAGRPCRLVFVGTMWNDSRHATVPAHRSLLPPLLHFVTGCGAVLPVRALTPWLFVSGGGLHAARFAGSFQLGRDGTRAHRIPCSSCTSSKCAGVGIVRPLPVHGRGWLSYHFTLAYSALPKYRSLSIGLPYMSQPFHHPQQGSVKLELDL